MRLEARKYLYDMQRADVERQFEIIGEAMTAATSTWCCAGRS